MYNADGRRAPHGFCQPAHPIQTDCLAATRVVVQHALYSFSTVTRPSGSRSIRTCKSITFVFFRLEHFFDLKEKAIYSTVMPGSTPSPCLPIATCTPDTLDRSACIGNHHAVELRRCALHGLRLSGLADAGQVGPRRRWTLGPPEAAKAEESGGFAVPLWRDGHDRTSQGR